MATPEEEEEDFTFPATTTDPPPRFIDSPPLWRPSFPSTSNHKISKNLKDKEVQGEENKFTWRSFQDFKTSVISQRKSSSCRDGDEKEEKMDMLWEYLNEEHSNTCGKMARNRDNTLSSGTEVQIRRVDAKALKLSKTNGDMFSGKKPSIVVIVSVLKKVLAMRNSRRSIKKRG